MYRPVGKSGATPEMREEKRVARLAVLSVGDSTSLGFFRGRIGYGGMPNDQTFSLGLRR